MAICADQKWGRADDISDAISDDADRIHSNCLYKWLLFISKRWNFYYVCDGIPSWLRCHRLWSPCALSQVNFHSQNTYLWCVLAANFIQFFACIRGIFFIITLSNFVKRTRHHFTYHNKKKPATISTPIDWANAPKAHRNVRVLTIKSLLVMALSV